MDWLLHYYKKIQTMKHAIFTGLLILTGHFVSAQLNSSNINVPASSQPVPNATVTEKSATPQPQIIAPATNPIPPIYPGAEVKAAETQRQIILPAAAPTGTQPEQKEPLSPIESTNNLQPNRPQREEASRENPAIGVPRNTIKSTTMVRTTPVKVKRNVPTNNSLNIYHKNTITNSLSVKNNKTLKTSSLTRKNVSKKLVVKKTP